LSYLINIHEQNTQLDWCKAHHVTTDTLRCHVVATPILNVTPKRCDSCFLASYVT